MQPEGAPPGVSRTPSGACFAAATSAGAATPVSAIASRTTLRRARLASGYVNGSSALVDWTMPASVAACGSERSAAETPKYVRAASSTPKEPWPKETRLR